VTLSVYSYLHTDTFKYVSYQKKLQINFLCHVLILRKINCYKNSIIFHFVACNAWVFKLPGTLEVVILPTDASMASKYKLSHTGVEYIRVKHTEMWIQPPLHTFILYTLCKYIDCFLEVFELSRVYTCVQKSSIFYDKFIFNFID
jgi:hypothetical protein